MIHFTNRLMGILLLALAAAPFAANADVVISTPQDSDRLLLCGKANLAATNSRLASDPTDFALQSTHHVNRRFDATMPTFMPGSYWGIGKNDAYICLGGNHINDSTWTLPNYTRTGGYDWFEVHVLGFKTNSKGNRIDLNGDGLVDDNDWTQMRYLDLYTGADEADSDLITSAFTDTWGSRAASGTVALSNYDGDGYPRNVEVSTTDGAYFSASMGQTNLSACPTAWQNCYVFGAYEGQYSTVAPTAQLNVQNIDFSHEGNRWLAYHPLFDSYTASDAGLNQFLTEIQFVPTFWVQAKDSRIDYLLP